ncbi:MAG: hypothetical protein LQ342_000601 [Letrouitia transgressa]|nr:MAG: hypothetical protein LQ342_000601 [Letrouitia transgressa]
MPDSLFGSDITSPSSNSPVEPGDHVEEPSPFEFRINSMAASYEVLGGPGQGKLLALELEAQVDNTATAGDVASSEDGHSEAQEFHNDQQEIANIIDDILSSGDRQPQAQDVQDSLATSNQEEDLQRESTPPTLFREDAILEESPLVDAAPDWPRLSFSRLIPAGRLQHGQRQVLEEILFHREAELDPPRPHRPHRWRTDDSDNSDEEQMAERSEAS